MSDIQSRAPLQITNVQLLARVKALASGLDKLTKLQAGESKVLFLLNDRLGEYPDSVRVSAQVLIFCRRVPNRGPCLRCQVHNHDDNHVT